MFSNFEIFVITRFHPNNESKEFFNTLAGEHSAERTKYLGLVQCNEKGEAAASPN